MLIVLLVLICRPVVENHYRVQQPMSNVICYLKTLVNIHGQKITINKSLLIIAGMTHLPGGPRDPADPRIDEVFLENGGGE